MKSFFALASVTIPILGVASAISLSIASTGAEAVETPSSPDNAIYLMCSRDGRIGSPGEPNACMQAYQPDAQTICSGKGDSAICESSLFSLCKAVGAAAGKPMSDQAGKGSFATRTECMARCDAHEASDGKFGGTCEGDITPN